ncbi:hypothetical protein D9756_000621 [Leucocoprinus leucothites]|uniref:AAA+ ATPase domain-containing protein n=1 Tax=Leucocoprinus leucothites TaxID=201217 RepID=A0A8H5LNJ5_9AGAR|nr:hypothetical protein D9756_000621 [Leucoagaricus leucothites]
MSYDKRRPMTSKSKATKPGKGQKTLLDMFGRTSSQQTIPQTPTPLPIGGKEGGDSGDTINSNDTLVTTPRRNPIEIPMLEDQTDIGPKLADTAFIDFDYLDPDTGPESPFINQDSSQGSRDAPIIIADSSPTKPTEDSIEDERQADPIPIPTLELKKKPFHPFFAPRRKLTNLATPPKSPRWHRTRDPEAAFPDRDSQHVKGFQTSYSSPPCPFERRHANTNIIVNPGLPFSGNPRTEEWVKDAPVLDFLLPHKLEEGEDPHDEVIPPTAEQGIHVESINSSLIREHPAIKRVVDSAKSTDSSSSSSGQLWTDAWRPRCAKEVLGNEHSTIYLRNWLHTLAIQLNPAETGNENKKKKRKKAKKRPRVVREVARKKPRRDGLEGFLAEDDEEDDVDLPTWNMEEEENELTNYQGESSQHSGVDETSLSSAFASDEPETINERLHNTILLSGPSGTGKTAAVFACAEELGWEVFEVYPGIGRRNGANVDNLVGEVGKNHLVRKKTGATRQVSIGSGEASAGEGGQEIRQSLILLEEVDLLFKDDVNFWPAVTNLIKECRRPVICTCNDASLVPRDELPLQRVLYFEPCAPEIGTAYLQGLARAEGYTVPQETLRRIYCDTYELSAPTVHYELPAYDLRRAIHRVQMGCTTGGRWGTKNSAECQDGSRDVAWEISHEGANDRHRGMWEMDGISQQVDLLSIVDEWVTERVREGSEALGSASCDDDENGHKVLYGGAYEIGLWHRGRVSTEMGI